MSSLLAVVKQTGALGEGDGVAGGQLAAVPLAVLVIADVAIVGVLVGETEATPVDVLLLNGHSVLLTFFRFTDSFECSERAQGRGKASFS